MALVHPMWSNKPVLTKKTEIKGLLFGRPFRTELPSTQIAGRQGTAMYYPPTIIEFVQSQVLLLPNRKLHKLQPHTNMLQLSQIVSQSHPHTHTPEKLMRHLRHVVFAGRENWWKMLSEFPSLTNDFQFGSAEDMQMLSSEDKRKKM